MPSQSTRRYGDGKPHIFKTKLGWCSTEIRNGIESNWFGCTFETICLLNRGWK